MIGLNRRRTMGNALPYDAEIEYIQGDGSAYIDTGVKATSNIRYECSFTITAVPSTNFPIFGGRVGLNNKSSAFYYYYSGTYRFSWRYGNSYAEGYTLNKNTGDFYATNRATARIMVVDNTASITCNTSTFTTDYTVYIFAMNNGGSISNNSSTSVLRIKWMKIYDGSTLVRDFIPVKKNSIGYLYDKVSGELFGNSGTGSFILGNDVN